MKDWSAMDREYLELLESIVREGVETGEFAPLTNPRIATLGIIGSLNWMTHWYRPEGPLRADAIADQFCDMFLAGLINRSNASAATKTARPRATARKTA